MVCANRVCANGISQFRHGPQLQSNSMISKVGPVLTVTSFRTEEEALKLANDCEFGLGAAVWTSSVARAHRVAHKIEAGIVWINDHHKNDPASPWGGFKDSGMGKENGWESLHAYTKTQSIMVNISDTGSDWFGGGTRYS